MDLAKRVPVHQGDDLADLRFKVFAGKMDDGFAFENTTHQNRKGLRGGWLPVAIFRHQRVGQDDEFAHNGGERPDIGNGGENIEPVFSSPARSGSAGGFQLPKPVCGARPF